MKLSMKAWVLVILLAAGALFLGAKYSQSLGFGELDKSTLSATVFNQPRQIADFSLVDNQNKPFTQKSFEGHWSLLFFGFTNCPSICPTTMAMLNQVYQQLQQDEGDAAPEVVLISIDPERDDVAAMNKYVSSFNKDFVGVTGTQAQIDVLAKNMNIVYMKTMQQQNGDNENYDIDHSGAVMLIDPKGQLYGLFTSPSDPKKMAQDILAIQKHYG